VYLVESFGQYLIARAARHARPDGMPNFTWFTWTASSALKSQTRTALNANLRFAESLGAQVVRLKGRSVADSVAEFVRAKHITQVIFGRAAIHDWRKYLYLSAVHRFLRESTAVDVHIVTQNLKSSLGLRCRGIFADCLAIQLRSLPRGSLEEEVARILEAPIDERHVELRAARPMISGKFRFDGHGQFVLAAMQNQKSVRVNGKRSLRRNFSFHAVGSKYDFRVSPALENLSVHFPVA